MTAISADQGLQLLAEHLGVSLEDLEIVSQGKREAARLAWMDAQIKAEQAEEARRLDRARTQFLQAWQDGTIVVRIDGKLKSKPCEICKDGELDMSIAVSQTMNARRKLLQQFNGMDGVRGAMKAATITKDIACTCGRDHRVEIFVMG